MSIQEVQIEGTRQNQGDAIKSKDWEQVRNKKFQEEDFLWNDSQFIINRSKDHQQTQQENQAQQSQHIQQIFDCEQESTQQKSQSLRNQNSRRFQYASKYFSSRSRTIEIDALNLNEISCMNQTQELTPIKDQISGQQKNQSLQTDKRNNNFGCYNSKVMVWITKLKLKLKNIQFNKTQKSKLLSSEQRLMINDQSDSIEKKESFLETLEKGCSKFAIFNQLKKIPLLNVSSKSGFYIKLILVWLNTIYLLLLSIFIIFQVQDDFSQKTFQIINLVWLVELIFNFNSQIQHEMEIITCRGRAFLIYFKKKFLFDLVPLIFNSQIEKSQSTLLFQFFQFLKLSNINHDLKYVELQLCMRVKKHYLIQLINLIFALFFIGHIIACLWYLTGYVELYYLQDHNSWLTQDFYVNATWWQIYFSTLYWSLTLMATGSNICSAYLEVMFTVIIMLFTTISFGYFITTIGDILSEMNSNDLKRKQDMNLINNYMRQFKISKELQANVNLYMQQYYQNNFLEERQNNQFVISKLSIDLQESLKKEQFKEIIPQIDILFNKKISFEALQDLALYFEEEFYLPNQKLKINNGQCLIFIIQGELEVYNNQEQENGANHNKKKVGVGKSLGLIEFITGISSNYVLKSSKFTQIVKINRTDFITIIKQNDQEYQKFCELRDKILFYSNFQDLNFKCSFCNSSFHQDLNCKSVNIDKNKMYYLQIAGEQETQNRVTYGRKNIKNINPLQIQQFIFKQALILVEDLKKLKQTDILEQLNITLSDSEDSKSENDNSDQQQPYKQSQKELESQKNSQNNISQKGDSIYRKHSIFVINKQSIKDLDDQQKCFDLNVTTLQEQNVEKLNIPGLENFVQNSLTILNQNQRATFKDFDKCNKEESENTKISEEKIDSLNLITQNRKQPHQATNKSLKNLSQKVLQRASHFFDNQDSSQKENFKQEIYKLMDNFKQLNQTIINNSNNRKNSVFFFNYENNQKNIKICSNQMMYYDFDQLKDYKNYFPLGNSKEVTLRQKNQIKKKFKRANVSFLFQSKM